MPNKLEVLLSEINIIIRQQVNKDSITPESMAGILDKVSVYATAISSFQLMANEEGYLIHDDLAGMNIGCIVGNGAILDGTIQFQKVTGNDFVSTVSDPDEKLELTPGYPYTITPIL